MKKGEELSPVELWIKESLPEQMSRHIQYLTHTSAVIKHTQLEVVF